MSALLIVVGGLLLFVNAVMLGCLISLERYFRTEVEPQWEFCTTYVDPECPANERDDPLPEHVIVLERKEGSYRERTLTDVRESTQDRSDESYNMVMGNGPR